MLPTKFGVNRLLGLGEEKKNRFSRYLGFPIGTIFAIFIYKLPRCFLPSLESTGLSEEAKNRFSWWRLWRPSWISDRNEFSYFWSISHPNVSYQVSSQLAQVCRRSRFLKQLLTPHDGRRTTHDGRRTTHDRRRTLTDIKHTINTVLRLKTILKFLFSWTYSFDAES